MRLKRILAFFMAMILAFSCAWNLAVNVEAEETPAQDVKIGVGDLRNEEKAFTWLFSDEEMVLPFNVTGAESSYQVTAIVGTYDYDTETVTAFGWDTILNEVSQTENRTVEVSDFYKVTDSSLTLHGEFFGKITDKMRYVELEEGEAKEPIFDVCVSAKSGEEELASYTFSVRLANPEYHYYVLTEPGEREMLTCDTVHIPNQAEGWEWTKEKPHGEDGTVEIADVKILEQMNWEDESAEGPFVLNKDSDGWNLTSSARGEVILGIYGADGTLYDTFEVYCKGVKFVLYHHYPHDNCDMLPDAEMELWTELYVYSVDEEGNEVEEQVQGYELSVVNDYDMDLISAVEINGTNLIIKSTKNTGSTHIPLKVTIPEEGNEPLEACDASIYVGVWDDVWSVGFEPSTGIDVMLPGDSMDLRAILWHQCYNREEEYGYYEDIGNVEYVWESLEEAFTVEADEKDPAVATVTASEEAAHDTWGDIRLTVYALNQDGNREKDEENNDIVLVQRSISLRIAYGYLAIEPAYVENTPIGETLDLNRQLELKRYTYEEGLAEPKKIEILDEVQWEYDVEHEDSANPTWKEVEATTETADYDIPVLERINKNWANIKVIAKLPESEGSEEYIEACRYEYWFDGLDYSFRPILPEGKDYIYLEEDTEDEPFAFTYDLDVSNLGGKKFDQLEVTIDVGDEEHGSFTEDDEEGFFKCNYEDDNLTSITVYPNRILNYMLDKELGYKFVIQCATIYEEGQEPLTVEECKIEIREPYIEYDYQYYGDAMLPDWEWNLYKEFGYKLNDANHPDDEYGQVEILNASVSIDEGNKNALELIPWEEDDGSITGWTMKANSFGHVYVTIEHTVPHDETTDTHEFEIWIGEDVWNLNLVNSNGCENLLPGDTKQIVASISRSCYKENVGHFVGDVSGVEYEWEIADGWNDDFLTIKPDENDPAILHVTADADAADGAETRICVRAYYTFEDGNREEVSYQECGVHISNGMWTIAPVAADAGMLVGETGTIEPQLIEIYYDEEGNKANQLVDDVEFRLSWDSNAFDITDADGNEIFMNEEDGRSPLAANPVYKVTRKEAYGTNIDIYAYVDEEEVFHRNLTYNELDYKVMVNLQDGNNGYIFIDDKAADETFAELTFLRECLDDKEDAELIVEVGYWNDDFVILENTDEYTLYEEVKENGVLTGIKVYPMVFRKVFERDHFNIKTSVKVGKSIVSENYSNLEIRDRKCDYQIPEVIHLLPGWGDDIGTQIDYVLYDEEHPNGMEDSVEIEDAQIRIENGEPGNPEENMEPCVTLTENFDENDNRCGWHIQANDGGYAVITFTFADPLGGEQKVTREMHVYVGGDVWNLDLSSDTASNDLRPGTSLVLTPHVVRDSYDFEKQEHYDGNTDGVTYDCGSHDEEVATITANEDGTFTVEAKDTAGYDSETRVWVTAFNKDEGNEERYEVSHAEFDVYIRRGYCFIEPVSFDVNVGETKEYAPKATQMYVSDTGNNEEKEVEDAYYRFEYNENEVEIYTKDEDGNKVLVGQETYNEEGDLTSETYRYPGPFEVKRLTNQTEDSIRVIAYEWKTDEETKEEYLEEIGDRWYDFDHMDSNLTFADLRVPDEGNTKVFADEKYALTLEDGVFVTDGELKEGIFVEWTVGQLDEEGNFEETYGSDIYTVSGATITLHGAAIHASEAIQERGGCIVRATFDTKKLSGDSVDTGMQAQTWVALGNREEVDSYVEWQVEPVTVTPGETIAADKLHVTGIIHSTDAFNGEIVEPTAVLFGKDETDEYKVSDNCKTLTISDKLGEHEYPFSTGVSVQVKYGKDIEMAILEIIICEHKWKDKSVVTAPTCDTAGIKHQECELCEATKDVKMDALGHKEVDLPAVAATETATGLTAGKKCSVCGTVTVAQTVVPKLPPKQDETLVTPPVAEHKHAFTNHVSNNDATVLSDGTKTGICSCGEKETVVDTGSKLVATIKVPSKKFAMKVKQVYKNFTVTMGKGDSIESVVSKNTKLVKVSKLNKTKGTFTLTAQKKTGKNAKVVIKLASGKSVTLNITVQKGDVKTTKITGLKNVSVKKGKKITLKPVIEPITSKQKVKYKTSNKKVATVNAKGVVTGKKKGKAKITVTSGSKKKTITVTVKQ